ncbi:hypothetical protein M405DRAFT_751798, partial [Rhizopogon salebrosus TDB-379]
RYLNIGLICIRQLFFARFDLKVHVDKAAEYTQLWNDLRESISIVKGGDLQPGQGISRHGVSGYDADYYGYSTTSLCLPADVYATFFKKDPFEADKNRLVGGSREETL